jgi:hypothetical protein
MGWIQTQWVSFRLPTELKLNLYQVRRFYRVISHSQTQYRKLWLNCLLQKVLPKHFEFDK